MKDIKQKVTESLDGFNPDIFPYLPYILQDLWEMGADPATVTGLMERNIQKTGLKVLDIGCGKGAVSVRVAEKFDCIVYGIDYMKEFIEDANEYVKKSDVENKCFFRQGDADELIKEYQNVDMVILGAVGPLLGDLYQTLQRIKPLLSNPGFVILDDGYLPDGSKSEYKRSLHETAFFKQIALAGFSIVEEVIFSREGMADVEKVMFTKMKNRVKELIASEPEKKKLFEGYLNSQEYEFQMLATELITGTWLLKYSK